MFVFIKYNTSAIMLNNLLLIGYISFWLSFNLPEDEQDQEMLEMQVLGQAAAGQGDSSSNLVLCSITE